MPQQIDALIISNIKIFDNYYLLKLSLPLSLRDFSPGQFIHVKIEGPGILLRRPFSVHRLVSQLVGKSINRQTGKPANRQTIIEILYEVKGKGTTVLSQKKPGEYLNIIGPLGNGFDFDRQTGKPANRQTILIAGGMGAAPLTFLAENLMGRKTQDPRLKTIVLIGSRTKSHILCEKEFKKLGCEVRIATDDGSKGFKGRVTDLLESLLSTIDYRLSTIYSCGPKLMLKEVASISEKYNIPAQVSLEEFMGCGIGACLGCVVPVSQLASEPVNRSTGQPANRPTRTYKRVCKDGPVFDAREIIWE